MRVWEVDSNQKAEHGVEFNSYFKLRSKESKSQTRITQFQPNETIEFLHETDVPKEGSRISEKFEIAALTPHRSKVRHTVDMTDSGLPLWVRLLMRFIFRFGKSVKDSHSSLDTLKVLVENELSGEK